jgi:GNAT superfamily N-acetyltransferase
MAKIYERKKEEKNSWCIISVYVSKPFQGRDIGRKIIETVEDEILKRGGKRAVLYVWEGDEENEKNKKVKDFYERLGYKIAPEKKYEIWERMEKDLKA